MADDVREDFRRYAGLIEGAMPAAAPFAPESETASAVQVERGTVYHACLHDPRDPSAPERVGRLTSFPLAILPSVSVVDRAGHHRPVYRPLLVYAWLQAYRVAYETLPRHEFGKWEEGLRPWCDLLEADLANHPWPAGGTAAAQGARAGEAAWAALALFAAGKVFVRDAWTDLASDTFGRLTRGQTDAGTWLAAGAADNPETFWFHELVLLHAAASYAVQAEDRPVAAAVARNTEFHLNETQPDHATNQPWGLFAFVWNAQTRPVADQLLHAATVQQAGSQAGLSSILLADALYCVRLFE